MRKILFIAFSVCAFLTVAIAQFNSGSTGADAQAFKGDFISYGMSANFIADLSDSKIVVAGMSKKDGDNDFANTRYGSETSVCTYALSTNSGQIPYTGGTGTMTVSTQTGCTWQATSNSSWITLTNASGTGDGTINFSLSANDGLQRTASIVVADQSIMITQQIGCLYQVGPRNFNVPISGGSFQSTLTTGSGCFLTTTTTGTSDWLSGGRYEAGTMTFSAMANTGAARSGTIRMIGQSPFGLATFVIDVNQPSGCTYPVTPASQSFSATGGMASFTIRPANMTCFSTTYTATSNASWLTVSNPSGGVLSDINYTVAANLGPSRIGTISVTNSETGVQMFTVNQGSGCTFTLAPTSQNFQNTGGTGSIAVNTSNSGCAWSSQSNNSWVHVTSGGSGTGNNSLSYSVDSNNGQARTGSITIADRTFTVTQANGCVFNVSGTNPHFGVSGGSGTLNISASNANCSWTASSDANWLTILSGGSGSGNGSINYSVTSNSSAARTGNIIISASGSLVDILNEVTQDSGCSFALSTANTTVPVSGGNSSFGIISGIGCTWTATSNANWLTTASTGSGNGSVNFTATANNSVTRTGTIAVAGQTFTVVQLARRAFDFDGDGKTDVSIFRPIPAEWWINRSSNGVTFATQFGQTSDKIVPADFTGDGKTDIAFWRPSTGFWFILRSEDFTFFAFPFGANGDIPVPADYDGDGKSDAAVFRPTGATWFVNKSSGGTIIQQFGTSTDAPVPADYDGDGKADLAIYRANGASQEWWYQKSTNNTVAALVFGVTGDKAVQGDYTGDGKVDIAVWRPSNGFWYILRSEDLTFFAFPFGANGDVPTPGDYDGDGKTDAAVFRPTGATWFLNRSTAGTQIVGFGLSTDRPLPNAFVP